MNSDKVQIVLSAEPLSTEAVNQWIAASGNGGLCIFVGTVRNQTKGKEVISLDFEAYEPMAISEMDKIAYRAKDQWPIDRVAIHHRVGYLGVGEIPVVIGVSAPHRDAAFDACRFCIDTLKETVPIWKKEKFEDGEVWVAAHP